MTDPQPYLQRIIDRLADPSLQNVLKGFNRTILFKFSDTSEDWLIRAAEGQPAIFTRESLENPDVTVTLASDTLADIMDKKLNGITAYMQGKIHIKGAMQDLMRLQKLLI